MPLKGYLTAIHERDWIDADGFEDIFSLILWNFVVKE